MATYDEAIATALREIDGLHWINAPSRGDALLVQLAGHYQALHLELSDDPLLAAYAIRDQLPKLYAFTYQLGAWARAVSEGTGDDIPETGARLCPSPQ